MGVKPMGNRWRDQPLRDIVCHGALRRHARLSQAFAKREYRRTRTPFCPVASSLTTGYFVRFGRASRRHVFATVRIKTKGAAPRARKPIANMRPS